MKDRQCKTHAEIPALLVIHMLVVSLAFNFIEKAYLLQGILGSCLLIIIS